MSFSLYSKLSPKIMPQNLIMGPKLWERECIGTHTQSLPLHSAITEMPEPRAGHLLKYTQVHHVHHPATPRRMLKYKTPTLQ